MRKLLSLLILFTVFEVHDLYGQKNTSGLTHQKIKDFSFLHVSDTHVSPFFQMPEDFSKLRSYVCIRTIKDLKEVYMEPYHITAPRPSLIIVSGDICEFSVPGVTWDVNRKYYEGIDMPVYFIAGNHDNTWVSAASKSSAIASGLNSIRSHG